MYKKCTTKCTLVLFRPQLCPSLVSFFSSDDLYFIIVFIMVSFNCQHNDNSPSKFVPSSCFSFSHHAMNVLRKNANEFLHLLYCYFVLYCASCLPLFFLGPFFLHRHELKGYFVQSLTRSFVRSLSLSLSLPLLCKSLTSPSLFCFSLMLLFHECCFFLLQMNSWTVHHLYPQSTEWHLWLSN